MTINLVLDGNNDPTAASPRVIMLANRIILYSDWRPDGTAIVDKEIRIYQPDDSGFYVSDLVSEINSSTHFTASLAPGVRPNMHSVLLVREDSRNIIFDDFISPTKRIDLVGDYLLKDSLSFIGNEQLFETEVFSTPTQVGEYLVDYTSGTIELFSEPKQSSTINYHHGVFPLEVDYTPIQVFSLNDDDFVDELFTFETLQSGEEVRALPNTEGSEIYHLLYKETNNLWGK